MWMIDRRFFIFYFMFLLLLAPFILLNFDSYYYWNWSRHLALSYYDGSPMIAYLIKPAVWLFGDNLFALSFVGILTTAGSTLVFYKAARLFLKPVASKISLALWLFSPLVTLDMLKVTTYDNPLTFFWIVTLYWVLRFLKFEETKDIYWIGFSAGLLLLSKYTGIVLFLGLFIFLLATPYRKLFKNIHFYVALGIALIIFSPVVLWNYQHDWLSFLYQLSIHQDASIYNPIINIFISFFHRFITALNFMLLPPLLCCILKLENGKENTDKAFFRVALSLCLVVSFSFIGFYLYVASHNRILPNWLACYLITAALLAGCLYQQGYFQKTLKILIIVYFVSSVGILIYNSTFFAQNVLLNSSYAQWLGDKTKLATAQMVSPEGLARMQHNYSDLELIAYMKNHKGALETHKEFKKFITYQLMQNLNNEYPYLKDQVFTSGWLETRKLFFLNNKPQIYTLGCGSLTNQYSLWSKDILNEIKDKRLKEIIFIDQVDQHLCLQQYFQHCTRLPTKPLIYNKQEYSLFVYKCHNE